MAPHAPSQEENLDQTERVWQNTDEAKISIMGHPYVSGILTSKLESSSTRFYLDEETFGYLFYKDFIYRGIQSN